MRIHSIVAFVLLSASAEAARVRDLVAVEGVRDNQLVGYGLVVGLAGTGDRRQTVFSTQTLANMLERMGVAVSPAAIQVSNTAAVMLTATLPPFAQSGSRIDVTVAAIGDARNLQGGVLVLTPLKAANGQVYAVAQGPVITGGFAAGAGGNTQVLNHPTSGRIPAGAIVEQQPHTAAGSATVRLQLKKADFTTAARIAAAINSQIPGDPARAESSAVVVVTPPDDWTARPIEFIAALERLTLETEPAARIVVNERTGTVTLGSDVRIAPVTILHGALTVRIQTTYTVSQPGALASVGETAVVPETRVAAAEEKAKRISLQQGATVEDLVSALVAIGSTPRDVIAILQALRAAGALDVEMEVI